MKYVPVYCVLFCFLQVNVYRCKVVGEDTDTSSSSISDLRLSENEVQGWTEKNYYLNNDISELAEKKFNGEAYDYQEFNMGQSSVQILTNNSVEMDITVIDFNTSQTAADAFNKTQEENSSKTVIPLDSHDESRARLFLAGSEYWAYTHQGQFMIKLMFSAASDAAAKTLTENFFTIYAALIN